MRVIQRLMGLENPIRDLKVYEHTLHFRQGVAVIDTLTEREINRLRAFGFRVERDGTPKKAAKAPEAPPPAVPELPPPGASAPEADPSERPEAPEGGKPAAKAKRPAPKKEA